jgi:DNA-binding MarR family transcriptional regulator
MDVYDYVGYGIKRVQQAFNASMTQALQPLGLTPAGYALLTALDNEPGLSNAQVARRGFVTPQTTHQLLQQLEHQSLVRREADPDHGRVLRTALTPLGRERLEAAHATVTDIERQMTDGLSPLELTTLKAALDHMARRLAPPVTDAGRSGQVVGEGERQQEARDDQPQDDQQAGDVHQPHPFRRGGLPPGVAPST